MYVLLSLLLKVCAEIISRVTYDVVAKLLLQGEVAEHIDLDKILVEKFILSQLGWGLFNSEMCSSARLIFNCCYLSVYNVFLKIMKIF